ncbi:MAG: hypothetical protein PHE87_10870 [Victivallaceae bacterium]|nr:hypothetical protein [Victivallaceae bacterium]
MNSSIAKNESQLLFNETITYDDLAKIRVTINDNNANILKLLNEINGKIDKLACGPDTRIEDRVSNDQKTETYRPMSDLHLPYEEKVKKLGPNDDVADKIRSELKKNNISNDDLIREYKDQFSDLIDEKKRILLEEKKRIRLEEKMKTLPSLEQLKRLTNNDFYNRHKSAKIKLEKLVELRHWIRGVFPIACMLD